MNSVLKFSRMNCALFFVFVLSASCSKKMLTQTVDSVSSTTQQTWAGAQVSHVAPSFEMLSPLPANSCSILIPESLRKDEELRVTIISQGVSEVNVSVNNGDFINIGTTNGTLSWAGNSFPPYQYLLKFRGVKADKTMIDCDPAVKTVTIRDEILVPPTTPPTNPPSNQTPISSIDKQNFKSLHQFNLRIAKKPAEGSYDYEFFSYVGYKNQYDPADQVAGCALGVLKNNICAFPWNEASTVAMNFTENMIGYNVPKSFRFYVSSGRTDLRMSGYAPQRTAFAFALRLGQPPTRTQPISATEYVSLQQSERIDTSYARLAKGEEIVVVHDGGGTVRFLSGQALGSGGWVFVKQLDLADSVSMLGLSFGQNLYDVQLGVVTDKNDFLSQYLNLKWGSDGDPL